MIRKEEKEGNLHRMIDNKLIGAVLLNFNDYDRTFNQLQNLLKISCLDEIVIVDNNSNQNEIDQIKKLDNKKVKTFFNNKNVGYGAGNNVGMRYLSNKYFDYVLLINNDIKMEEQSVIDCTKFLIKNKEFAVCSPLMIEKGKYKRNFYDIPTLSNTLNFVSSTFSKKCKSMKEYDTYIEAEYVRESATIYNLHHFKQINYFDENIFMFEEGPSTGFLFRNLGYKEAIIKNTNPYIHNHCGPLINRKLFSYNKKSRYYFFKNYHKYGWFKLLIFKLYWVNIFIK